MHARSYRGRDWGLGILLDSGCNLCKQASLFDGVSCHINIRYAVSQFSPGYDQLAEKLNKTEEQGPQTYSPNLRQIFISVEYDDRQQNPKAFLHKQVGIYGSQIVGSNQDNTDLWHIDLYLNFALPAWGLSLSNELLLVTGKTNSYYSEKLGGYDLKESQNKINTNTAFAGNIEWIITQSTGSPLITEDKQSFHNQHSLKIQYVAPGEENGYYDSDNNSPKFREVSKRTN